MTGSGSAEVTAVVLCGGESRRFGSDKTAALLHGRTLLDHVLDGLPYNWPVVCVGAERPTCRKVPWVREDPPGGGPLAGVVAGARAAATPLLVVLAADMPYASEVAPRLVAALPAKGEPKGVCARDDSGQVNPLLAAYRRKDLLDLVGDSGHDRAAKTLLRLPHAVLDVSGPAAADVDYPEDLNGFPAR